MASPLLKMTGIVASMARLFFAIAMMGFGVQHLIYAQFRTRLVPGLPAWIPGQPLLAYVLGVILIATGMAVLLGKRVRQATATVALIGLCSVVLLYPPLLAANLRNGGMWTNAGKALALSGAALLVAGSIREEWGRPNWFDTLVPLGRFFVGIFLILAGYLHFVYPQFVATLVPAWIPGHIFWTYFAGVALIAGGLGMMVRKTQLLAGYLSGLMVFLWVILLHIPRALAAQHDSNETTAVFEALAISGAAFLVATNLVHRRYQTN